MNYLKQYAKLIRKAQRRDQKELEGIYTEKHHVFPVSIYGKNRTLVTLTYKEHIVAHHLLAKALIKRYGRNDKRSKSMIYAITLLANCYKARYYKYNECPRVSAIVLAIKQSKTFKKTGFPGKPLDEGTKKKISDTLTGRPMEEYVKLKLVDNTLRDWVNFRTGEVELQITSYDLRKKHPNLLQTGVVEVTAGRHSHHHGWRLAKEGDLDNFDPVTQKYIIPPIIPSSVDLTKYNWHNPEKDFYEFGLTVIELNELYPHLKKRQLHLLKRGKIKSHQGWVVLKD